MEGMVIDTEILQSRVSSMQAAIISMENPKTAELRNEVAQLRDELEEEKAKNVSLDLQVKLLNFFNLASNRLIEYLCGSPIGQTILLNQDILHKI